jgi:hypothetical protein
VKERGALARIPKQADRIGIFVGVSQSGYQQQQGCKAEHSGGGFHGSLLSNDETQASHPGERTYGRRQNPHLA